MRGEVLADTDGLVLDASKRFRLAPPAEIHPRRRRNERRGLAEKATKGQSF